MSCWICNVGLHLVSLVYFMHSLMLWLCGLHDAFILNVFHLHVDSCVEAGGVLELCASTTLITIHSDVLWYICIYHVGWIYRDLSIVKLTARWWEPEHDSKPNLRTSYSSRTTGSAWEYTVWNILCGYIRYQHILCGICLAGMCWAEYAVPNWGDSGPERHYISRANWAIL